MANIPQSIGIIMDGNRRFAKALMKKPWLGHKFGVKKARDVLRWACELGIKYMTIYALSDENLKSRPKKELKMILKFFDKEIDELFSGDHIVHDTKTRVKFIGKLRLLPKNLREKMKKVERMTCHYKDHFLDIAVAYGSHQEIVDVCKMVSQMVSKKILRISQINENLFSKYLYSNGHPYPDLIIRTGGEKRLSNFFLWQSAYSELFFVDKKWPELDKKTFLKIIKEFQARERRYGK